MEEEGTVSLWLGDASSREAFEAALAVTFSADGDSLGSPFSRAFRVDHHDEGLGEAEYFDEASRDLAQLLKGASYDDVVIERFQRQVPAVEPANCVVLLFNYRHEQPVTWTGTGVSFRFLGSVTYR